MIIRQDQPTQNRIELLPREKEGNYQFNSQFVATRAAIEKFVHAVIVAPHMILLKEVERKSGLGYLQVFDFDGEKLWLIDDVTHVTCLLPDDY